MGAKILTCLLSGNRSSNCFNPTTASREPRPKVLELFWVFSTDSQAAAVSWWRRKSLQRFFCSFSSHALIHFKSPGEKKAPFFLVPFSFSVVTLKSLCPLKIVSYLNSFSPFQRCATPDLFRRRCLAYNGSYGFTAAILVISPAALRSASPGPEGHVQPSPSEQNCGINTCEWGKDGWLPERPHLWAIGLHKCNNHLLTLWCDTM